MDYEKKWFSLLGGVIDNVPSIYYLWQKAQPFVLQNDKEQVIKYQNLIKILHNSAVSPYTKFGEDVKFGYGGIGVVIHKDSIIGDGVTIGQNVTIGGAAGKFRITVEGNRSFVPSIKNDVYIATGSKIIGGIVLGEFSILGANSVATKEIDAFSIYAGNPAKKIASLNRHNALRYKSYFHRYKDLDNESFLLKFPD